MYNLVIAFALAGRKDKAVAPLNRLARMGLVMLAERDEDFNALRGDAGFRAVLASFERNKLHLGSATPLFTVPEKMLIPEGIA